MQDKNNMPGTNTYLMERYILFYFYSNATHDFFKMHFQLFSNSTTPYLCHFALLGLHPSQTTISEQSRFPSLRLFGCLRSSTDGNFMFITHLSDSRGGANTRFSLS
mmetsp:Transcript_9169/g.13169  ORF Transcript_9169/g.13169 Transcript_9169/m.13169 type:complete len:106 (+) Transcript_9169:524-841(+)